MSEMPTRIVLTGFMATGKTSVGRELARLLGYSFADTDAMIEAQSGMSIADIFADPGEEHFRQLELELCEELLGRKYVVIASGGGTVLDPQRRELLCQHSLVANLHAGRHILIERIRDDQSRPLLFTENIEKRIDELLSTRSSVYNLAKIQIDTGFQSPQEAALELYGHIAEPAYIKLEAQVLSPVLIEQGLLRNPERLHALLPESGRVFLLSDDNVMPLHGDALAEAITETGRNVRWLTVPPGEDSKSLARLETVLGFLADNRAGRDSLLLGLGGGMITDLAGLAASLYMRGIRLLQFPTSLMGMLDAAIGGKTAVNFHKTKNLIGSFHLPDCVACDPQALATLPDRELRSGLAELVKYDMLSGELIEATAAEYSPASRGVASVLERCIRRSALQKCQLVSSDYREEGERKLLNFGHTIGHALESLAGDGLLHGEAIGLGMLCACRIASERGMAQTDNEALIRSALEQCRLPVSTELPEPAAILKLMRLDKKNRAGEIRMVLPLKPGQLVHDVPVDPAQIAQSLEAIRK
jgi:3-dehydroquinate synthase